MSERHTTHFHGCECFEKELVTLRTENKKLTYELDMGRKDLAEIHRCHAEIERLKERLGKAEGVIKFYAALKMHKPTHACDVDVRFQIDGGDEARDYLKENGEK